MKKALLVSALVAISASAGAQVTTRVSSPLRYGTLDQPNSARIGVFLGENTLRDTLGVLVNSVIKDSPADKAGIKEGDRIASIDGVSLRMSRDDADDAALRGMMTRRLTRELDKRRPGDEVELSIASAGSTRTVRVKTVAARELDTKPANTLRTWSNMSDDRAALGVSLGGAPSKRDTLGVFVAGVTAEGPAEKAGIVEGDRIARINGMDLRVQSPEAGEPDMSRALVNRFTREVGKLKAGDAVTLTVVTAGRSREVKLTAAKASELRESGHGFYFGDGMFLSPKISLPQIKQLSPGVRTYRFTDGENYYEHNFNHEYGNKIRADIKQQVEKALEKAREAIEKADRDDVVRRYERIEKRGH